jgi:hypothetical protein
MGWSVVEDIFIDMVGVATWKWEDIYFDAWLNAHF